MQIEVTADVFRLAQVFTISRGSRTEAKVLTVRITDDGVTGMGECVPYARYGETLESVTAEIKGNGHGPSSRHRLPGGASSTAGRRRGCGGEVGRRAREMCGHGLGWQSRQAQHPQHARGTAHRLGVVRRELIVGCRGW